MSRIERDDLLQEKVSRFLENYKLKIQISREKVCSVNDT